MVVLSTSKEIENLKHPRKSKNPKFQFSKIPIFQKNQRNQKNQKKQFCTDHGGKRGSGKVLAQLVFLFFFFGFFVFLENWNFGKLEFWKIGILEIAVGGGGGLRQNSILSVAQKSIETQYKYRNKIQTK